ncbi:hypothetical protein ACFQ5M_09910 [Agrilactobacillus yilanensis]|uniref:Uncharacterized protein n=1 Tax=Agrilactobacillus yilanensis TaxID=2485997 RepID=A0ABW4J9Y0_9LACO|nr:hypothetical protein [Agrilactobacillus yilanensis]
MKLTGKEIVYDEDLTDAQVDELHQHYLEIWDALKQFEFKNADRQLQVLYQEPDNTATYEAAFFTLQVRHFNDRFHFDEYNIIINNKSTFNDSDDESVIELAKFDDWAALTKSVLDAAKAWVAEIK